MDHRKRRKISFLPSAPFCCTALDVLWREGRLWSMFLLRWTSGVAYLLLTHFKMGDRKERLFHVIAYLYGFIFQISLCKVIPQFLLTCHDFFFLKCHVYKVPSCFFLIFLVIFLYNLAEFRAECYHIRKRVNHMFPVREIILIRKFKLRISGSFTRCCLNVCLHMQEDFTMKKWFVKICTSLRTSLHKWQFRCSSM